MHEPSAEQAESVAQSLGSVTMMYEQAKSGDSQAPGDLWDACSKRLFGLARAVFRQRGVTPAQASEDIYLNRFPQQSSVIEQVPSPGETVSLNQDSSVREEADVSGEMTLKVDHSPARPTSDDQQPGRQQIGRYTVLQELGGGGQEVVYRAAHPTLPIEVAIKVGRRQLSDTARQAMLGEAHVLCDLDHANRRSTTITKQC